MGASYVPPRNIILSLEAWPNFGNIHPPNRYVSKWAAIRMGGFPLVSPANYLPRGYRLSPKSAHAQRRRETSRETQQEKPKRGTPKREPPPPKKKGNKQETPKRDPPPQKQGENTQGTPKGNPRKEKKRGKTRKYEVTPKFQRCWLWTLRTLWT